MPNGNPKQPPWTIREIEPRHHLIAGFDTMDPMVQLQWIRDKGYSPFDIRGDPVLVVPTMNEEIGSDGVKRVRYCQKFKGDYGWRDPVRDNLRTDDPWFDKVRMHTQPSVTRETISRERDGEMEDVRAENGKGAGFTAANR